MDEAARIAALCLSRAGVIGVSLSALLSGSGAVNGPATSLHRLMATVDARELDEAKRSAAVVQRDAVAEAERRAETLARQFEQYVSLTEDELSRARARELDGGDEAAVVLKV